MAVLKAVRMVAVTAVTKVVMMGHCLAASWAVLTAAMRADLKGLRKVDYWDGLWVVKKADSKAD